MSHPLLQVLRPDLRAQLRNTARLRKFSKGEVVFHQGDPGDVLHLVNGGRFAAEVLNPAGQSMIIRVIGAGEYFGELSLASPEGSRNATVSAMEPSRTLAIHRRDFDLLRKNVPEVDRLLVAALALRVQAETQTAMELAFIAVEGRVHRRLFTLAMTYRDDAGDTQARVTLSQDTLAGLAGTTRATANRVLRSLEKRGIVELQRNTIMVRDLTRLRLLANFDQ